MTFLSMLLALLLAQSPGPAVTGANATSGGGGTTNHARMFNGTSDFLQSASTLTALNGATQLSLSFDLWWDTFANDDHFAMESSSSWTVNPGAFVVDPDSTVLGSAGSFMWSVTGSPASNYFICYFTRPSAGAWHHYVITMDISLSTPACTAYVDGTSQTVSTAQQGSGFPASLTSQTLTVMSRNGSSLFAAGRVSSPAAYSGIVNSTDASSLASCARPTTVTSATLLYYWPINQTSPEVATTGGVNLNVTGTTNTASPCSF